MKYVLSGVIALAVAATVVMARPSADQQKPLDPIGSYTVTTSTDTGDPLSGTLVITASGTGYTGQFTSATLPNPIPVLNVATNENQMMAALNTGDALAFVWLEFAADGSFKGTWHELSPGIATTGKKNK